MVIFLNIGMFLVFVSFKFLKDVLLFLFQNKIPRLL